MPYGVPSLWAWFVVLSGFPSSPPAVLNLCGCCALFSFWFPLLQGGCASGLQCLGHMLAALFVQSLLPFIVGTPSAVCLSYTCSGGTGLVAVFWPLLLLLWVELPWGVCCGILSPWPLVVPYPSVVSNLGSSFGVCFFGRLRFCLGSFLFFWGGGGSPSLVLVVFAWLFQLFCCPGSLSFLNSLLGFFPLASSVC